MPRRNRTRAGYDRPPRRAVPDAWILRRGDDLLPRLGVESNGPEGRCRRGRGHRTEDLHTARRAGNGAARRDRGHENGRRTWSDLIPKSDLQARASAIRWYHTIDLGQGVITDGADNTPHRLA